jgi:AcrR family transcriptional regulator
MSDPVGPRRRDFEDNRTRLLQAARKLIAERGPEGLAISEVVRRADLNRTTAYKHFRTRDELVAAVMESLASEVGEMLAQPLPFGERIDYMARFFVEHPEIGRLMLHHLLSENPFPRAAWDRFVGQLARLAKSDRSQDGIHPEMFGHILMAIGVMWPLQANALYDDEGLSSATDALGRELKRLLLYGVLKPDAWPELVDSVSEGEE